VENILFVSDELEFGHFLSPLVQAQVDSHSEVQVTDTEKLKLHVPSTQSLLAHIQVLETLCTSA
jgi:hypothetical protein